jgi:hypothetical protein
MAVIKYSVRATLHAIDEICGHDYDHDLDLDLDGVFALLT